MRGLALRFTLPILLLAPLAIAGTARADDGGGPVCVGGHAKLAEPASYCAVYRKTGPLTSDKSVREVAQLCENFFQEARTAVDLFCGYVDAAKKVGVDGSALAAATDAQAGRRGSLRNAKAMTGTAKQVYDDYLVKVENEHDKLVAAEKKYRKALKALALEGQKRVVTEVHCLKNGEPGRAEGAQVVGVAKFGLEYDLEVAGYLLSMLRTFHTALWDQESPAAALEKQLAATDQRVGTPTQPGEPPLAVREGGDPVGYTPKTSVEGAVGGKVTEKVPEAIKLIVGDPELAGAEAQLASRAASTMRTVLTSAALGVALGGILQLATAEKVDTLSLMNVGIGVFASAVGFSAVVVIGIGVAADYIEATVRLIIEKRDLEVLAPFLKMMREQPELASDAAAKAFAPYKAKRQICQACPLGPDCNWSMVPYNRYNSPQTLLFGPTGQRQPGFDRTRVATHPEEFYHP
jgi:hypothetical protein